MKRRTVSFVIVCRLADGSWKRHTEQEFNDKTTAESHLAALVRRYPKREFALRSRAGR